MNKLPVFAGVIVLAALFSPAAVAAPSSWSEVSIALPPDTIMQGYDEQNNSLTSSKSVSASWGSAAARTAPGSVGMRASIEGGGGARATIRQNDFWHAVYNGPGAPPAVVPVTLAVKFHGILDPLFDRAFPTRMGPDMFVKFRITGYSENITFDFLADYESGERLIRATYDKDVDVSSDVVWDRNHISFDRAFTFNIPFRDVAEQFDGMVDLDAEDSGGLSTDFYSSFETTLTSNHPDVEFTSDGGRTTVPEPAGLMLLLLPALAAQSARRRVRSAQVVQGNSHLRDRGRTI